MTLIIVGGYGGTNVGESFAKSALQMNVEVDFLDHGQAYNGASWLRKLNWYWRGRKPLRLEAFSQNTVRFCKQSSPCYLLTTGLSPLDRPSLESIGDLGVQRINYLTDDPWNKEHYAPWFFKSLRCYDVVFTPRRSNYEQLVRHGCKRVIYLPFGYDPEHFYAEPNDKMITDLFDVVFVGGADADRVPYIAALHKAGMRVALYGSYWERFKETRELTLGQGNPEQIRKATASAKIALCLVRRANRDGHVMRSFEIPAVGTCMLAEDTEEHREIFGDEGVAVPYFSDVDSMVEKAKWLLRHDRERTRLASAAHSLILRGQHTYKDRLQVMLNAIG